MRIVGSPALLDEVARGRSEGHRARVVHMITSTPRMQEELRVRERCERFQSLARLMAVHEEFARAWLERYRVFV